MNENETETKPDAIAIVVNFCTQLEGIKVLTYKAIALKKIQVEAFLTTL